MRYTLSLVFIFMSSLLISQNIKVKTTNSQIGILKTETDKILGYAFVAMNENVVFTAAHNITYTEKMIFEDAQGNNYDLRVVATDKVGDIGVLMSSGSINDNPYALNLNYSIDQETELFGIELEGSKVKSKIKADLKGKSSKIEKKKEFKSIELVMSDAPKMAGMPILNAYNEVIGIVTSTQTHDKGMKICKVSIMDSDMWKKM